MRPINSRRCCRRQSLYIQFAFLRVWRERFWASRPMYGSRKQEVSTALLFLRLVLSVHALNHGQSFPLWRCCAPSFVPVSHGLPSDNRRRFRRTECAHDVIANAVNVALELLSHLHAAASCACHSTNAACRLSSIASAPSMTAISECVIGGSEGAVRGWMHDSCERFCGPVGVESRGRCVRLHVTTSNSV